MLFSLFIDNRVGRREENTIHVIFPPGRKGKITLFSLPSEGRRKHVLCSFPWREKNISLKRDFFPSLRSSRGEVVVRKLTHDDSFPRPATSPNFSTRATYCKNLEV